ncbi:MAG: hypothetical protein ACR2L2_13905 [Acidobacteriota bacterium]
MPAIPFIALFALLLSACALLLFFLARHAFVQRPEGLQKVLSGRRQLSTVSDAQEDFLAALLLTEERYPHFAALLQTILRAFPLERFIRQDEFVHAAGELAGLMHRGVRTRGEQTREKAALATLIRVLLNDPEVQLRFGDPLRALIDEFLEELNE